MVDSCRDNAVLAVAVGISTARLGHGVGGFARPERGRELRLLVAFPAGQAVSGEGCVMAKNFGGPVGFGRRVLVHWPGADDSASHAD